jgi:hypothetical protein
MIPGGSCEKNYSHHKITLILLPIDHPQFESIQVFVSTALEHSPAKVTWGQ